MQKKLKTLKGNKIHNSYNKEFFLLFVLGHPEGILKEFTKNIMTILKYRANIVLGTFIIVSQAMKKVFILSIGGLHGTLRFDLKNKCL